MRTFRGSFAIACLFALTLGQFADVLRAESRALCPEHPTGAFVEARAVHASVRQTGHEAHYTLGCRCVALHQRESAVPAPGSLRAPFEALSTHAAFTPAERAPRDGDVYRYAPKN